MYIVCKCVLRRDLKISMEVELLIRKSRLFQSWGAAEAKAQSPHMIQMSSIGLADEIKLGF